LGKEGIPYGVAVNPVTNRIYVIDIGSNSVHVIDGLTNDMITSVSVGKKPVTIALNVRSNTLYLTNHDSNDISIIDGSTNQLIKNLPAGGDKPAGIAFNPISKHIIYCKLIKTYEEQSTDVVLRNLLLESFGI
jgi:YVTN family beta-propeller protein